MYPVSAEFQDAIKSTNRTKALKVHIETAFDEFDFTEKDVVQDSLKLDEAAVCSDTFGPGGVFMSDLSITLFNTGGRFDDVQLNGGRMTIYDGTELSGGSIEYVPLGVFNIDDVSLPSEIETLQAHDNLLLLDCDFSDVKISYPATCLQIINAICAHCGVVLATTDFYNCDYVIAEAPDNSSISCRDALSDICEICASFARCNRQSGAIEIVGFKNPACVAECNINGGTFADMTSGDSVTGGNFAWWNNRYRNGGVFGGDNLFNPTAPCTLNNASISNINVATGSLTVTSTVAATFCYARYNIAGLTPGASYYFSATNTRNNNSFVGVYKLAGSWLCGENATFIVPSDGAVSVYFYATLDTPLVVSVTFSNIQLSYIAQSVSLGVENRYNFKPTDAPITITGITFDSDGKNYLVGSDFYAVKLSDNPFIQGDPAEVLNLIFSKFYKFTFLPFESDWQGNPAIQPGDVIKQTDKKGNDYLTIVTNSTYKFRGVCQISAKGASMAANGWQSRSAKRYSKLQHKLYEKQQQIDALDTAINNASMMIAGVWGGHVVIGDTLADEKYHGNIFICDNIGNDPASPDVTKAVKVWRWNLGGFGYSENGIDGDYKTAITADGSIVANLITASMIKTGILQSLNGSSWIDLDSGAFSFGGGAMSYDTANGFNCVAAHKIMSPEYPNYYGVIGATPDGYIGLELFDKTTGTDKRFCSILELNNGGVGIYDGTNTTKVQLDSNGILFCKNDSEVGYSGITAQGFNYVDGLFTGGGPSTVLSATISIPNGSTLVFTNGMLTAIK